MGRVLKSNSTAKNRNAEIDDARENNDPTWQTRIHHVAVEFASTFVGQAVMMQFDKLLWTLEKTATWISNGETDGKRSKAPVGLVRPLPWVFFLPTLVALRLTRVMLSLVSICFGFDEIEASTMVGFLHESRRSVRQVLIEVKRNKASHQNHHQDSSIDCVKQMALSFLSNLRILFSETPDKTKTHNNKTSLNASVIGETVKGHRNDAITNNDESKSEEEIYKNFISRTIESSDTDDDDFVYESNGEDISDTDSQSSVATEDLSDEDEPNATESGEGIVNLAKVTNGTNENNHSSNTTNAVDQTEIAEKHDAQPPSLNEVDDILNRLIETAVASTSTDVKGVPVNRGKNIIRKNGRSHAKSQNNGKPFAHAKSKTTKQQHVESTADFIAEAAAADRT